MSAICTSSPFIKNTENSISCASILNKFPTCPRTLSYHSKRRSSLVLAKCSDGGAATRLPEKNKPIYAHSLPCLEEWLKSLGFCQSKHDRAVWFVEKPDWHAHLSLDVTELHIRYLKTGPGNLEKDVERRFSYALSRADIENAILGGP